MDKYIELGSNNAVAGVFYISTPEATWPPHNTLHCLFVRDAKRWGMSHGMLKARAESLLTAAPDFILRSGGSLAA